ncbi:MAG: O-antigen ligase family protein, partial [Candidatus Pacebacteria bacterium]|nr:O-antigen ligase family protein [Candidatus Paceibacterota bacterium]
QYLSQNIFSNKASQIFNFQFSISKFLNYLLLVISFILLILTVSRSAWLAALFATLMFLFIFLTDLRFRNWQWRNTAFSGLKILASLVIALGAIYIFHLTNFQLGSRATSAGTGLQQITIACEKNVNLPEKINDNSELEKYDCQQINLQDIAADKVQGKYVTTIYRNDPNIATRSVIYQKSWQQIKNNPILGIGWGNISQILGTDARGVPLNSSNIFLETWLGAGLAGFLALVILLGYILFTAVKNYFYTQDDLQKTTSLFIIISWFGLIIANLFNAGIFLGIFWVWLAIAQVSN